MPSLVAPEEPTEAAPQDLALAEARSSRMPTRVGIDRKLAHSCGLLPISIHEWTDRQCDLLGRQRAIAADSDDHCAVAPHNEAIDQHHDGAPALALGHTRSRRDRCEASG